MTAPDLVRTRIVVREVTQYERVVLMPRAQMVSLQQQLASGSAEAKSDVAVAMFDSPLIDNGSCDTDAELLEVCITEEAAQ